MEEAEKTIIDQANKLLSFLGVNADCQLKKENDHYYLDINSTDSSLLIGRYGANLDALELILNVILTKKEENLGKVAIDVCGFRKKREEQLLLLAQKAVQNVKETGKPEVFYNLSSRERRVIHLALSNDQDIETKSEGEGEGRRLIVQLKQKT